MRCIRRRNAPEGVDCNSEALGVDTTAPAPSRGNAGIVARGTAVALPQRMRLHSPVVCSLALLAALAPNLAAACWDGIAISTDKVVVAIEGSEPWSPEQARHWATWIARIDALVPAGKTLSVTHGDVEVCEDGGACQQIDGEWSDASAFWLFEHTADLFAASRKQIASARHTETVPYTVQLAASHDLTAAEQLAARINAAELEVYGFLDVGGFPSSNPYAHVVESSASDAVTYHVVVGAFLEQADADAAMRVIEGELGMHGFVRPLDQSSITEEGC
jgi:SPOR domain